MSHQPIWSKKGNDTDGRDWFFEFTAREDREPRVLVLEEDVARLRDGLGPTDGLVERFDDRRTSEAGVFRPACAGQRDADGSGEAGCGCEVSHAG